MVDSLLKCDFGGFPCDVKDFHPVQTGLGRCYQFNGTTISADDGPGSFLALNNHPATGNNE